MSRKSVADAVRKAGIPVVYMAWPKGSAPDLPWAAFRLDEDSPLFADGRRFAVIERWAVELYQASPDPIVEQRLEGCIAEAFGPFSKEEIYIESEACLMTAYRFTETERM